MMCLTSLTVTFVTSSVFSVPAAIAADQQEQVSIEVSLEFDKDSYRTDEAVHFTFTINNVGTVATPGLRVHQLVTNPNDLQVVEPPGWGRLTPGPVGPSVVVEPGESFSVPVSGTIRNLEPDTTVVRGYVSDDEGLSLASFDVSKAVTKVLRDVAGTVFGDRNGNGTLDSGEALPDITVSLEYNSQNEFTAKSDANGRFSFAQIPVARYDTGGDIIGDWLFPLEFVKIDASGGGDSLLIRGVPALNGALHAAMQFTKDTYRVGELAQLTVTLSNSGDIPLVGIVVACNRGGAGNNLSGLGEGWGALASDGVTIGVGETRAFDVSETVPPQTIPSGKVSADCDFGYREVDVEHHATASAQASLRFTFNLTGEVLFFPEGRGDGKPSQGVPGVRLVLTLLPDFNCLFVGEQTTEANGHFEFNGLGIGRYLLWTLPPAGWTIEGYPYTFIDLQRIPADRHIILEATHGDAQPPSLPTLPAACAAIIPPATSTTPAPQGRPSSGLANTGVNLIGLSALGALALLAGAGTLVVTRRRGKTAR